VFYLFKWANLVADSPDEQTRNKWLYRHGAFARYKGIWFPCKVNTFTTIGEPAQITAIPIATNNMDVYPNGMILASECEVLYSCFADGMSIQAYIQKAVSRKNITDRMLTSAIKRSLNTELLYAPKRLLKDLKRAANREDRDETFVLTTNVKDEIGVIELPRTVDIVEKLWNSNDWALQEISQMLGISYNPSHGKKERTLEKELLGDRDLTIMNREMITSRLIVAAEKFKEKVSHISTEVDTIDRELSYGNPINERMEKENVGNATV